MPNEWKDDNERDFPRWLLGLLIVVVVGLVGAWALGWFS